MKNTKSLIYVRFTEDFTTPISDKVHVEDQGNLFYVSLKEKPKQKKEQNASALLLERIWNGHKQFISKDNILYRIVGKWPGGILSVGTPCHRNIICRDIM